MTSQELLDILREIQINKCETRTLEIKAAEHGIAMGLGNPELLMASEYVTDSIYEDGIYKAFKYYKLI